MRQVFSTSLQFVAISLPLCLYLVSDVNDRYANTEKSKQTNPGGSISSVDRGNTRVVSIELSRFSDTISEFISIPGYFYQALSVIMCKLTSDLVFLHIKWPSKLTSRNSQDNK